MFRETRVAAVIPTKNVAGFITGALASLWFCDEIIVVDMHSTDATREICERFANVHFFERDDYIYGNFNFGVDQTNCDWIIRLDSDERLSPELADEIIALLAGDPDRDCYDAPFISYIDGNPIRHGMSREQPTRKTLFRRGTLRYRVQSEHEDLSPVDDRPLKFGRLENAYHHFSTPSISTFWRKIDHYTDRDFERAAPENIEVRSIPRLLFSVCRRFCAQYFWHRGYRDGYAGFVLCAMNQAYQFLHEVKGWERKNEMKAKHAQALREFDERVASHARSKAKRRVAA